MKEKILFPMELCGSVLLMSLACCKFAIARAETPDSPSPAVQKQVELVKVTGVVLDDTGQPLPGATLLEEGVRNLAVTDSDGKFSITVASNAQLKVIYMGFADQIVGINARRTMRIVMKPDRAMLDELVVVGYGVQKKESSVGAISSVKSEDLLKSGGVTSVAQALQGKIPGLVTMFTNGEPGADDIRMYIRGQSTWNNSGSPLVLVDGVERSMNDVNMEDVESISVLKDASATAVYGVKGANGVILLTSKRGHEGKASFSINTNTVMKRMSRVPRKCDAYEAMMIMNEAVMNEVAYNPSSWDLVTPVGVAERYRNQPDKESLEKYPNVDWKSYMFRKVTPDYQVNACIDGGNAFAKYYCSIGYLRENDILKAFDNGKGYRSGYNYNRFNYRANIDLEITTSTKLSVSLSGIYGVKQEPGNDKTRMFLSLYTTAPDLYYPVYSDGALGYAGFLEPMVTNSMLYYFHMGSVKNYNFKVDADIKLSQNLDFIAKGLQAHVRFTMDNSMGGNQAVSDKTDGRYSGVQKRWNPKTESWDYEYPMNGTDFNFTGNPWTLSDFTVGAGKRRLIDYEAAVNYAGTFDKHSVGALALFKRQEYATGNMFRSYNEDWVFRVTYDYAKRYLLEVNGAYNGSEQFGPGYRFEFFPSVGLGWVLSNEKFMHKAGWIDRIKFRASLGMVGDDNFTRDRWLYQTQWVPLNYAAPMNCPVFFWDHKHPQAQSPYRSFQETMLGNKDIHWEKSFKQDYGVELSFLNGAVSGEFDYFLDRRSDIYIPGNSRAINDFLGIRPPGANLGKVDVHGFEAMMKFRHHFNTRTKIYGDFSYTHAADKVLFRDDPALRPAYQKNEGYSIGQNRGEIAGDIMQNWDDVYMSTPLITSDDKKRVGYYDVVDFNGDGNFNPQYDNVPTGFPTRPQNTWTASLGGEWNGLSLQVQFFGQFNSTRMYRLESFTFLTHLFFDYNRDYWSKENPDGAGTLEPLNVKHANMDPFKNKVDASMVRLKMVELSYRLPVKLCKKAGIKGLRFFFNGNNLALWSKMPDDRDFGHGDLRVGAYPTMKRFNMGLNLNL